MPDQLSMLDTMFLELEQADPGAHMHIGAALIFEPLPGGGTPTLDQVRAHVRARAGALPRFAQRLSDTHAGSLTWLTWKPDDTYDPDAHVHHATLPAPGNGAELHAWLADFWSHRLDRGRPLWEMTLLDGLEGDRWALVTKTHHCLADGVGSIDIGYALLDATPDAPPSEPVVSAPEGADHGSLWSAPVRVARAGLGAARHPRSSVEHVRAAAELIVRDEVVAAPATSLNGATSGTRDFVSVRFDLADIKDIKDRLGGTVNDVVLAICTSALRELLLERGEDLPPGGLRAQVPVNIRPEDREHALGNELTSLFVELPVAEPDPAARYFGIVERAQELKAGSQRAGGKTIIDLADLGPPLAGNVLARSMFGGPRMFNLTITNVPGPQQPWYAFGAPMVEVMPLVPLFAGHTIGIAVVSYAGSVVFGINADRTAVPDLAALADGIRLGFRELFD
jgi:WS/DGAT/MGAT family acyltransferase